MDDKTVSAQASPVTGGHGQVATTKSGQATIIPTQETEHRKSYGTAKTEDLRDSGLWRIISPVVVIAFCLVLFAVPLMILIPLLATSLDPHSASRVAGINLIWIWTTLIIVALGIASVVVWGLVKIFLTQAGNYHKV